jgi:hypothetical protein
MAVAAQELIAPDAPEPAKRARRRAATWPKPSQLKQSVPILRLLAEIWSIPRVSKVGLQVNGPGVQVWVVMPDDDRDAESKISAAERAYLNATMLHAFELDVVPLSSVREMVLPPFETVLER